MILDPEMFQFQMLQAPYAYSRGNGTSSGTVTFACYANYYVAFSEKVLDSQNFTCNAYLTDELSL